MGQNKRIEYISLASVISAIAVVFLHTNNCFWNFSTAPYWFEANIIESTFYFAVPIFFMISGAMLIDFSKKYSLKEYFSKRFHKTVVPYFAWSLIGVVLNVYVFEIVNESAVNVVYIINGLLNGTLVQAYWFFIPLFCVYLAIPLFSAVSEDKRKEIFTYVTAVAFLLNILIPFLISLFGIGIKFGLSLSVASGYLFFTLAGYLIHTYDIEMNYRYLIYVLAVFALGMMISGTYSSSIAAGEIISLYKGYYNLPCVLYSVGMFVFIKYDLVRIMKFGGVNKVVNFLNGYTFGVYLIHIFVLMAVTKFFVTNSKLLAYRLLAPFVYILISIAIIWLLRKIPYVRKIVP